MRRRILKATAASLMASAALVAFTGSAVHAEYWESNPHNCQYPYFRGALESRASSGVHEHWRVNDGADSRKGRWTNSGWTWRETLNHGHGQQSFGVVAAGSISDHYGWCRYAP